MVGVWMQVNTCASTDRDTHTHTLLFSPDSTLMHAAVGLRVPIPRLGQRTTATTKPLPRTVAFI